VGNCEAVAKETIWQRWSGQNAPLTGGLLFSWLLSLLTVWFTFGAPGPIICACGFGLALLMGGLLHGQARNLMVPAALGVGAVGLVTFAGGFSGPAVASVLWPVLAMASANSRATARAVDWFGTGLSASLSALLGLALLARFVDIPIYGAIATQSGILALGSCAALIVAAIVSRQTAQANQSDPVVRQALKTRDAALLEAEMARDQNRERAQFMAEMSHEIRTPLNAILGFADTMRAQVFGPLPQAYGDYPNLIHTSGSHLLEIVSDLLDLSKIEAGRYETNLKPIALADLAREGADLSSGDARALGVSLRHEGASDILVMSDRRALRQMIFNLVSNAIKFTPASGSVVIRTRADTQNGMGLIEVEDTGLGMSEATLARIGQPWNQAGENASSGQRGRGSGLGLALVKRLAELQGGSLSISSTLGVGTKAIIALPLAPALTPPV
jgi:signal transduction histidine kinase